MNLRLTLPVVHNILNDWNGLCIEYALPNSSLDRFSANWVRYIGSSIITAIWGNGATGLAISFLGVMVMPDNPFLHSAFGAFQEDPETHSRHQVCYSTNTTPEDQGSCKDLDLNRAKSM
ncbi:hypothetical protein LWI29_024706 [Acer saccharum]|uniref:Uncharacterized protein n=1 Tax=Acer saccharum TaxID=4024 RepID=A0AA39S1Q5_ACESA|nr:hypothetical protein LWI29_024706 [Acer saccharum]